MKLYLFCSLILILISSIKYCLSCDLFNRKRKFQFYLIKPFYRSNGDRLYVTNVDSLESCMQECSTRRGLAFNYSPSERQSEKVLINSKTNRDFYWNQPQLYFNCHILKCPENSTFKSLINDSLFDYYSLYERAITLSNYICIPEVGLFVLRDTKENFENASLNCQNLNNEHCGALAHIISAQRTIYLKQSIIDYNEKQTYLRLKPKLHLVYVGLKFNRTQSSQRYEMTNMEGEKLKCFQYRAWEPGNPKQSSHFYNSSCVALTSHGTWLTVDCKINLPYFCEIYTNCEGKYEWLNLK